MVKLPTLWGFVENQGSPSDTTNTINKSPIYRDEQPLWETLWKLKLIGKLFKILQLLNSRYLLNEMIFTTYH